MAVTSVAVAVAGFVLAVSALFGGLSFGSVPPARRYGRTSVACRIWRVVLFVDMFVTTGIRFCVLPVKLFSEG